jgi:hypothetical protein
MYNLARIFRIFSSPFTFRRYRRRRLSFSLPRFCRLRLSRLPFALCAGVDDTTMVLPGRIMLPVGVRRIMPPPKYHRRLGLAFLVNLIVLFVLFMRWPRQHPAFYVPESKPVIHGSFVDNPPSNLYPLVPFPYSPKEPTNGTESEGDWPRPWLAAVICAVGDTQSRMKIRSSWMRLYRDVPFDGRFVVSNPGPRWTEMIAFENRTYGDMIVLDRIQEDDFTANTIKTLEFYKYIQDNNMKYEFISKLDTDSWVNARGFWDRFLVPRMSDESGQWKSTVSRTVISELYYSNARQLVFPNGSMYTITWDLVAMFVALQAQYSVVMGEDMAFSLLLLRGKQVINFVNFRGSEKFDYDDKDSRGDGTAWARSGSHPTSVKHAIATRDAILIHNLKTEVLWYKVANCFDEHGMKEIPPSTGLERRPPFVMLWFDFWYTMGINGIWRDRFEDVPHYLWKQVDGDWICYDIYNLGPNQNGYNAIQ